MKNLALLALSVACPVLFKSICSCLNQPEFSTPHSAVISFYQCSRWHGSCCRDTPNIFKMLLAGSYGHCDPGPVWPDGNPQASAHSPSAANQGGRQTEPSPVYRRELSRCPFLSKQPLTFPHITSHGWLQRTKSDPLCMIQSRWNQRLAVNYQSLK